MCFILVFVWLMCQLRREYAAKTGPQPRNGIALSACECESVHSSGRCAAGCNTVNHKECAGDKASQEL